MKKHSIVSIILIVLTLNVILVGCSATKEEQVALREEGIQLMDEGSFEQALLKFNDALALSYGRITDTEIDLNYYRGACYFNMGDYDNALLTYTNLISYDKENYEPYFLRGCVYVHVGDAELAVADFSNSVKYNKDNYELYLEIYKQLDDMGFRENALQFVNLALQINGNSVEDNLSKGRLYMLLDQNDQAEPYLQKAADRGSDEAAVYLCQIYQASGRIEEASALLQKFVSSENADPEVIGEIGDMTYASGDYQAALLYYRTGLSLESIGNVQQLIRGEIACYEQLDMWDEAKETLAQYVAQYPNDEEAVKEYTFLQTR